MSESHRLTTASGLVFIGATNDRRFRAFDAKSGKELWATRLGQAVNANPMSYRSRNGKQYVAVVANSQLVAFTLPQGQKPSRADICHPIVVSVIVAFRRLADP
jgi:glucose dehydrogenase